MSQPWFIAVQRFGPANGETWTSYLEWSKLHHLEGLISLDMSLCPTVLKDISDSYWPYIVNEDYYLNFFTDLAFLRTEVVAARVTEALFLCVYRNPIKPPILPSELNSFRFVGFDLVEAQSGISALVNCGGWAELENKELSKRGLIMDHGRALRLQQILRSNYPEEPHANCDVWAVFAEHE